jgi:hypothetical protein
MAEQRVAQQPEPRPLVAPSWRRQVPVRRERRTPSHQQLARQVWLLREATPQEQQRLLAQGEALEMLEQQPALPERRGRQVKIPSPRLAPQFARPKAQ